MRFEWSLVAVVACSGMACGTLVNGSFEFPKLASPDRVGIGTLTDWTAVGGNLLLERGINGVSQVAAHSGAQFVSMGHDSAKGDVLFQDIATFPGQYLEVTFYLHCIEGSAPQEVTGQAIDVGSNAVLGSVVGKVDSPSLGWLGWQFHGFATGAQTRIRFTHSLSAEAANVALDTVTIVPSPAALGVIAGVVGVRRRRRECA